ncbi:4-hydroxy-3-methylbut-2-enyl diphosphate reductase [Allocatelliglobosispora scoriae]|uniref:4-hydroxy-3-methylbut-2-enyl diphosphate reductase n=1 Tax=Allocatelliglobosispora scoriae TaxID=643052 RepID=A0A841BZP1_9ACTN|nr:4-hydroxy-3-methylbut-2-enyl diphosphate reductase [Allocatelliglobosispora scoriae]MBB5873604.1 4-hydroxy-3-methylbut-2-enyl diphosphate reductase [Allocatelliglobosispora scoriae]
MGRVLLAAPRGYCAGVDRAIEIVEAALARYGPPIYVRREIVHNSYVVGDLASRGVVFVKELDEIPAESLVIFSAHGVAPSVRAEAEERGLTFVDATCPLVSKVHAEARRFDRDGYDILLVGHADHEEVVGTVGQAADRIRVVDPDDGEFDLAGVDPDRVVWLSQTTLAVQDVTGTVQRLKERLPQLRNPPSDDICYASQNRQDVVRLIADRCQLVLVVGSQNSSNSIRLVEVARQAGADAAYLIDRPHELRPEWLDGVETVGVTAGASAPELLIQQLLGLLAEHGYADVEPITTVVETERFALPAGLRTTSP